MKMFYLHVSINSLFFIGYNFNAGIFTGMFLHLKVKSKFILVFLICIKQSEEVYANIIT